MISDFQSNIENQQQDFMLKMENIQTSKENILKTKNQWLNWNILLEYEPICDDRTPVKFVCVFST